MSKSGQARVLSSEYEAKLFAAIRDHRHPEKNTAIMQISFKLGLRVQEIALLQIKEVAQLDPKKSHRSFQLHEIMTLPAIYTKGADALNRTKDTYERTNISLSKDTFDKVIRQVEALAIAGGEINPEDYYPPIKKHKGKSRDIPMVAPELRGSLEEYLAIRLDKDPDLKPSDPLFITQKGGPYSPNTLQEHMSLMLKVWAGVEKASSHSGRRTVITNIIHKQKKPVKTAQKIAGHVSPSTTIIYEESTEEEITAALKGLSKTE